MTTIVLWRFAAASAGSVLVAAFLLAMLVIASRRWPALAARRSAWMLAHGAVCVALALALMAPMSGVVAPVPMLPAAALDVDASAPMPAARSVAADSDAHLAERTPVQTASLLPLLAFAWPLIYCVGLLWRVLRIARGHGQWSALLAHAHVLDARALRRHGAFSSIQLELLRQRGLRVFETDIAMSPMLIGVLRPRLVLPAQLRTIAIDQQALIVVHELTHWRRRDTLWLATSNLLQALLWFNLPLRALGQRLHCAVELGCDAAVLEGRSSQERRSYAAALVAQLRQRHTVYAGMTAFGSTAVGARIERMRCASAARLPTTAAVLLIASGAVLVAASALLQPAFAAREPALAATTVAISAGAAHLADAERSVPEWRYPLDQIRVTSLYGVKSAIVPYGHHGIDFAARRGTPVQAVADGTVIDAGYDKKYGNFVRIDHGQGRASLSIHLDTSLLHTGDAVHAGQRIGTVGSTGMATGPHLHLEYWQNGVRRDPQLMFADLPARATATALARRAAQLHTVE